MNAVAVTVGVGFGLWLVLGGFSLWYWRKAVLASGSEVLNIAPQVQFHLKRRGWSSVFIRQKRTFWRPKWRNLALSDESGRSIRLFPSLVTARKSSFSRVTYNLAFFRIDAPGDYILELQDCPADVQGAQYQIVWNFPLWHLLLWIFLPVWFGSLALFLYLMLSPLVES